MTANPKAMDQQQSMGPRFRLVKKDMLPLYICLGLPLLIMAFVFVYPLVYSFALSVTNAHLMRPNVDFVGLRNYMRILNDARVWHSIRVTLTYAAGAMALQFLVGFGLALLIDYIGVVRGILRTLIVIPLMLTPVVVGVIWRTMLNYDFGIINYFVRLLGFDPIDWVYDPNLALPALIAISVWGGVPFIMLVLSAGLAAMPREPFESAQIDGASSWQTLRYLTIPMLRPVIMVVVIFRSYQLLREFDVVFTLTKGGPARATETLTYHIYARMFEAGQIGISAAIAYLLFFITLAIVVFLFTQLERGEPELSSGDGSILRRAPIRRLRTGIAFVIDLPLKIAVAVIDLLAIYLGAALSTAARLLRRGQAASGVGRRERRRLGVVIASVIVGGWIVFALLPVFWIYISSVKEPPDVFKIPPKWLFTPTAHNYEVVLGIKYGTEAELSMEGVKPPLSRFREYIINSVLISGSTTLINITAGMLAAYALVRLRFRGKEFILVGMLFTRMVPPIMLILPIFLIWRQLGLLGTYHGLAIAYLSFGLPFSIWMMRGYLLDIPADLEEAAMVDGSSRLGAFFRVTLPLAAPGLAATAVFNFIGAWNEFFFAIILGNNQIKTVTVEILTYVTDYAILFGRLFAAAGLILLPIIIFTFFVQKYIATGLTGGALKG
ncbi:MAG: ABC transporter permease subunit [Chloroflexi bacterium]|nr:ABC transporter permease subunit [Chloroflexota bacterium]